MNSMLDTTVGPYRLTRLLAAGGMAAVFEAVHEESRHVVAVKVLRRDLRGQRDPLMRMIQEGRVIVSLQNEHIVRVYDYGTLERSVGFLVMERLHGRTLAAVLSKEDQLDAARAAHIARQICEGLSAAHARGVYHRDVKPDNIFLADGQRHRDFVKLLDFGIAKLDPGDPDKLAATATGITLGTPEYMSPEQATASTIDARSDLYQVGLVLYEMLVGTPPFVGRNPVRVMKQHLTEPPTPVRALRPDVSEPLESVILRCLEKRPAARYSDAPSLAAALDRVARHDTAGGGYQTLVPRAGTRAKAVIGNLRLPTLGSPGDLERYARNLHEGLAQLWPDGSLPDELTQVRKTVDSLTETQTHVGTDLALRRAEADELAREIEERLRPLERAIATLELDLAALETDQITADEAVAGRVEEIQAHDADYARVYDRIESHQAALYQARHAEGPVDFSELFQEDIDADLGKLELIFRARSRAAEALAVDRERAAGRMRRIADHRLQIAELQKSRLGIEAERTTRLAERMFTVAELENRAQAIERALEHRCLQLGLAFLKEIGRRIE